MTMYTVESSSLTNVANAIRAKTAKTSSIVFPTGFVSEITAIPTGIVPTGNINITTMNSTDVTNYATAKVVDADITAANIKSGVNILGVTGNFTADATATAGEILSGKTAYINGTKITGTITSKATTTYTPSTSDQTIASGQYLSGIQTISGDVDLVASNIKSNINIFGVTGNFTADATATAGTIVTGVTAYVNGNKITGTMAYAHDGSY